MQETLPVIRLCLDCGSGLLVGCLRRVRASLRQSTQRLPATTRYFIRLAGRQVVHHLSHFEMRTDPQTLGTTLA